ncbi:MAG: COX15/CtaA family protein [Bacteroidota bacterium]
MDTVFVRRFSRLAQVTLIAVYFVILAGAVVRATGSGMGCPDWPKCFGQWVPPTDSAGLPEGYKEHYIEKRKEKNARFAGYLRFFGMNETADRIMNDPAIYTELEFNAAKTWIEYANRLAGALLGVLMLVLLIMAFRLRKHQRKLFAATLFAFVLLGFEGWFGSIVVSTNLLTWTITLHMILAFLLIFVMTYITYQANALYDREQTVHAAQSLKWPAFAVLFFTLLQVLIGTQVREEVDIIAGQVSDRGVWISMLSDLYIVHRTLAWAVLLLNTVFFLMIRRQRPRDAALFRLSVFLMVTVVLETLAGIALAWFAFPALAQPLHLLLASMIFGIQSAMLMRVAATRQPAISS